MPIKDRPPDRDYAGEMRALIDKATLGGTYVPAIVATEIVEDLTATDPDLLDGWLRAQAVTFLRDAIGRRDHSLRAHIRMTGPRMAFAGATTAFTAGDTAALRGYLEMPFRVAEGTRRLGALTHDDLRYVRDSYRQRVAENQFYVTVMEALMKRVVTGTVADHYTENQLCAIFSSFRA